MRTYLNEIHQQYKDNIQYANYKDKNDINLPANKLTKNKSGLFLNNFFRTTNANNKKNEKIYNSFKKSTNINSNKNLKNYKKKKKINVTPYQGIKNEYILNLAMDNLNKYQENLLLKESIGENWSGDKLYLNLNLNNENENSNINNINNISNQTDNLDFISKEKNKNINILKRNSPLDKSIMNKTQENFGHKDSYYKNYYISDELFNYNDNIRSKDNIATKPKPYLSSKSIINNDSNIDYNNNSNININYEQNYENKFNTFINKEFNLKNEKNENTKISTKKNKEVYDEKLIFVLTSLELNELIKIFEQNYIYFDDLFLLTKEDFMEMKIPIGPRNRIINFMEKYKNIAKTYDMEELSSFMEKYKQVLINSNDNDNFNFNVTPSTNNKYKSTTTSENNKNKGSFDSHGSDLPGKGLNMSNFNFEDAETISPRLEEKQTKKNINSKPKNRNRNRNQEYEINVDNKNKIFNDINQIINETNLKSYENNKINELQKNGIYNKEKKNNTNNSNNINKKKYNSSRIKDKYSQKPNINNDENFNLNLNYNNNENINSGNIFSNSLFNEFSRNINDINETLNMNNINETNNNNNLNNINKSVYNKNSSFNKENINNIMSTNSSNAKDNKSEFSNNTTNNNNDSSSLNLLNNKKNYYYKNNNINNVNMNQNTYKTFQNIFSEIENYQMNYEKMKKENDNRNNKINNLLEKKNRPNLQYLKMKIKNSKYYNEEDLKNESVRDLKSELEKMNFQKENDNNELNSMKYNPSQNYLKARNNRTNNNPLIEEFNKHK